VSASRLRIATRASRLALWQAEHLAGLMRAADAELAVQIVEVATTGDRDRLQPLPQFGGVGVFTREVQTAVLDGRADLAVHSLKDLPTEPVPGLTLAAVPQRGSKFDLLVWPTGNEAGGGIDALPPHARVGTGSLRRRAQLLHHRPDLQMCNIRGNVETRLRKLDEGDYDALVLAEAGLERLKLLGDRNTERLQPPVMFPAVGQGAIGVECRAADDQTLALLQQINHEQTWQSVTAERSLLAGLRAGCHAPLGINASVNAGQLVLEAVLLSADGQSRLAAAHAGAADEATEIGQTVAVQLRRQGADDLLSA
jgi:hydroxymethylbilane synthase